MRSFARYDIPDADRAVTLEQAARFQEGCEAGEDSDDLRLRFKPLWVALLITAVAAWAVWRIV